MWKLDQLFDQFFQKEPREPCQRAAKSKQKMSKECNKSGKQCPKMGGKCRKLKKKKNMFSKNKLQPKGQRNGN
jgi:hypothetical protein